MMKWKTCFAVCWLVSLTWMMVATPIAAQVPQDTTFTGRLVNDSGDPIAGPVSLELRIFDSETSGTQLYSESHIGVPLDTSGGFSVQLGMGTSPSGSFNADLFSDVDRWVEVLVGTEVLTPRQIIGSVPWALVAERANEIVRDPNITPRFEDCGDGTVADHKTGLQWEKKTGTWVAWGVDCSSPGVCPDPHDVNNRYQWSSTGTEPDGGAFTDFLTQLGTKSYPLGTSCFLDHCDWRLPEISELQTIMIGPEAAPGQDHSSCTPGPCWVPVFAAEDGPTEISFYLSASSYAGDPNYPWIAYINTGYVGHGFSKTYEYYVRAVRTGSCN